MLGRVKYILCIEETENSKREFVEGGDLALEIMQNQFLEATDVLVWNSLNPSLGQNWFQNLGEIKTTVNLERSKLNLNFVKFLNII